jgi:hypothetical protein
MKRQSSVLGAACVTLLFTWSVACLGCSKDEPPAGASPSNSAEAAPPVSAPAPSASEAPSASATPPEPPHDCPTGSSGVGSFAKPCESKGTVRFMDVKWKKTGDTGPSFAITNKSPLVIVWGKIAVYFYDKAGKQLDVKDTSASPPQSRPYHTCAGKFFGGVMNAAEKAVLTFSCVPKSVVPDDTASIEAEMQMVGFADSSGKKVDFYWRNNDLTPDARPKGAK